MYNQFNYLIRISYYNSYLIIVIYIIINIEIKINIKKVKIYIDIKDL